MLHLGIPSHLPYELDEGFDATFARLRRWFRSRGVPNEEAADLAQEVIARSLVHLRRHGFDPSVGCDPLLNTIGRNLLIDRARSIGPVVVPIEAAEYVDEGFDPSDEVARAAARRAVRAAIGTLSARHRRAMLLTLDGLSPAEIADHFGIQRNAADALLHRARRRLADQLRATVGATLGWVAVIVMRARNGARRMTEIARQMDYIASGFALNIATATLAMSILGLAPGASGWPVDPSDMTALKTAAVGTPANASPEEINDGIGKMAPGDVRVFRREERVSNPSNPVTGDELTAHAGGYYEPDPNGNEGIIWPFVRAGFAELCDAETVGEQRCIE